MVTVSKETRTWSLCQMVVKIKFKYVLFWLEICCQRSYSMKRPTI